MALQAGAELASVKPGRDGRPPTARSVAWSSASIWSAPDRSGLLGLEASSIWSGPDGSRRIVWMIKRMIKQSRRLTGAESSQVLSYKRAWAPAHELPKATMLE
jgi:hypothetical protein